MSEAALEAAARRRSASSVGPRIVIGLQVRVIGAEWAPRGALAVDLDAAQVDEALDPVRSRLLRQSLGAEHVDTLELEPISPPWGCSTCTRAARCTTQSMPARAEDQSVSAANLADEST